MATKLLLLEDVEELGRSGEIVQVKPGYARNYLLPKGLAMIADKRALNLQQRLKEEREKQAIKDKAESQELANRLNGIELVSIVKVDQEGHMYGSVTLTDIVDLLQTHYHLALEKKMIQLKHAIKATGAHSISVKLKEGVTSTFTLKVISEEDHRLAKEAGA